MDKALLHAARVYGIHTGATEFIPPQFLEADGYGLAQDALPALITTNNSGVPAFMTTYVDPTVIEILTTPNQAAQIMGESKMGDWVTKTAYFPVQESAGEVSSYSDYSNQGRVTSNVNWPQRQSYGFQCITQWGDEELARMGEGRIDWAAALNRSSALLMDKYMNLSYFFGVQGLQNYGLLNSPQLTAAITPGAKTGGGFVWGPNTAGLEIYADIVSTFVQLQTQCRGNVDRKTPMQLCLSPEREAFLTNSTQFNVNVSDLLKKNFPNMRVTVAVEYATGSGQLMQLIVDKIKGQEVVKAAFTEKMRAHNLVVGLSAYEQKKSAGTWGAILKMPIGVAQMLGI